MLPQDIREFSHALGKGRHTGPEDFKDPVIKLGLGQYRGCNVWLDAWPEANRDWLAALRDKQVGKALAAIHRDPNRPWTAASLAREVGMSRSGFSARFTDLVGDSAMRYLTQWRMQTARAQLLENREPLSLLAKRLGYQSEAAFCRVFKRVFGVSPGSVRSSANVPHEPVMNS